METMDNLRLYNQVREVPKEAQKAIGAGRLKGMTDINPMWRIKALTELFGPCGDGWWTENEKHSIIPANAGEVVCVYELDLVYRLPDGTPSKPVHGVGGSCLVAKESKGLYVDDEAVKKAKTDALSVAAKALGVAADIYFESDSTKYQKPQGKTETIRCEKCGKPLASTTKRTLEQVANDVYAKFGQVLCIPCAEKEAARREAEKIASQERFIQEVFHEDAGDRL